MAKASASSARVGRAAASGRRTRQPVDFSDIPEATPAQLASMRRVGRPPLGDEPRQLVALRIDRAVLDRFRQEAKRRGIGYQTLMHDVLARFARRSAA